MWLAVPEASVLGGSPRVLGSDVAGMPLRLMADRKQRSRDRSGPRTRYPPQVVPPTPPFDEVSITRAACWELRLPTACHDCSLLKLQHMHYAI